MTKITFLTTCALMAFGFSSVANASGGFTYDTTGWIGPHFNLHFGSGKVEYSLGVEASYWITLDDTGLGIADGDIGKLGADLGTEYNFSRKK